MKNTLTNHNYIVFKWKVHSQITSAMHQVLRPLNTGFILYILAGDLKLTSSTSIVMFNSFETKTYWTAEERWFMDVVLTMLTLFANLLILNDA